MKRSSNSSNDCSVHSQVWSWEIISLLIILNLNRFVNLRDLLCFLCSPYGIPFDIIGIFKSTAHSYENEILPKKFLLKIMRMKSSNDCSVHRSQLLKTPISWNWTMLAKNVFLYKNDQKRCSHEDIDEDLSTTWLAKWRLAFWVKFQYKHILHSDDKHLTYRWETKDT